MTQWILSHEGLIISGIVVVNGAKWGQALNLTPVC